MVTKTRIVQMHKKTLTFRVCCYKGNNLPSDSSTTFCSVRHFVYLAQQFRGSSFELERGPWERDYIQPSLTRSTTSQNSIVPLSFSKEICALNHACLMMNFYKDFILVLQIPGSSADFSNPSIFQTSK